MKFWVVSPMQMIRKCKTTPGVKIFFLLLILGLSVTLSSCGVFPEKSQSSEQQSVKSGESEAVPQVEASNDSTSTTTEGSSTIPSDKQSIATEDKSTGAQVIEPTAIVQQEIKLEPIPEPPASSVKDKEATSESINKTEEIAAADASMQQGAQKNAETKSDIKLAKIEPALGKSPTTEAAAPISPKANHFTITVAKKDRRHPKYGEGHEMGFLINGVPGGGVVLERGKTYQFDVVTNPKHDVYISKNPIGWGASPWSEGVEGAYIYQGTMTFTPGENAPSVLYYSCRNHPNMGGAIHIINPGEKFDLKKLAQASSDNSVGAASATSQELTASDKPQVTVAMVNQKLMFADMLVNSANSSRVKASAHEEAKQMQDKAEKLLGDAKNRLKAGDNQQAYSFAEEALKLLKSAARLVPSEEEMAALRENHKELLTSVEHFEQSHKESFDRMLKANGNASAVDYDKEHVAALKEEARVMADKNDYSNANKKLQTAQRLITTAIQKMLNSQTIVYDLNFETAEEEYEYELKRFGGYEELVPIAVEQKQPNEGTQKLMESFVKKGQNKRDIAMETAKGGDFPRAIAMLQDATKEIRRALRMVGVMQ